MPFDALRRLDAGAWFGPSWRGTRVPSLEEALALLTALDLHANVEIKPCPGPEADTAAITVETIQRVWPSGRPWPLLSRVSLPILHDAKDHAPRVPPATCHLHVTPDLGHLAVASTPRPTHIPHHIH